MGSAGGERVRRQGNALFDRRVSEAEKDEQVSSCVRGEVEQVVARGRFVCGCCRGHSKGVRV